MLFISGQVSVRFSVTKQAIMDGLPFHSFFNTIFTPSTLKECSSSSTGFERFKLPKVHFLLGYNLYSKCRWKGGRLSVCV
jgi:hypothetical protein